MTTENASSVKKDSHRTASQSVPISWLMARVMNARGSNAIHRQVTILAVDLRQSSGMTLTACAYAGDDRYV